MKLLDTNVLVYARDKQSPFYNWARQQISELVAGEGAGFSSVSLDELCSDDKEDSSDVPAEVKDFGIELLDWPCAAAVRCGEAYKTYRQNRKKGSGKDSPKTPLPDFFIGAHAECLGLELVTNDPDRYRTHFPKVRLNIP